MPRTKLTDLTVQRFKPPPPSPPRQDGKPKSVKRVEHWDAALPGFGLRVTENGIRTWVVMYRMGGRARRLTIGRYPALSLADARALARDAMHEVAKGNDPGAAKAARNEPPERDTFADAAEDFLRRHAGKLRRSSWQHYTRVFERTLMPRWGRRRLADLGRADVIELLDDVMDVGGPYAANHALAIIKKFFSWCIERGRLDASPCVMVKRPHDQRARDRVLSDDELRAIWGACGRMGHPFDAFSKMLLVTAQRRSEVARMRWPDLDLEQRLWTIRAEDTKANRTHEVPLSAPAMAILESVPHFSGAYVFTSGDGQRPVCGFSRAKARLVALSGVAEDWRFHDFRRTAGTRMVELGVPIFTVGRVLNHSAASMAGVTAIYDRHSYLPEKRHALEAWAQKLTAIVGSARDEKVVLLRG
ncbi:MAG: tyrosine-type recombinase/integrase [Alphaproteobacteria bacterium]